MTDLYGKTPREFRAALPIEMAAVPVISRLFQIVEKVFIQHNHIRALLGIPDKEVESSFPLTPDWYWPLGHAKQNDLDTVTAVIINNTAQPSFTIFSHVAQSFCLSSIHFSDFVRHRRANV